MILAQYLDKYANLMVKAQMLWAESKIDKEKVEFIWHSLYNKYKI